MKRQRGRNRNNNHNNNNRNNSNRSMDSNGPDVKVRGNASTIYEKYTQLARDAKTAGNRVKAESLLQHAEHYLRLMNEQEAKKEAEREAREAERAEREAKRAERGDAESGGDNNRSRGQRRPRDDSGETNAPDSKPTQSDNERSPDAPKPRRSKASDNSDSEDEEKPKRRRRAPPRAKDDDSDAVEAAE